MRHTSSFPPLKHLHNLIFTQSLSVIANTDLQARVRFFFSSVARIFMNFFTFKELPFGTSAESHLLQIHKRLLCWSRYLSHTCNILVCLEADSCLLKLAAQLLHQETWISTTGLTLLNVCWLRIVLNSSRGRSNTQSPAAIHLLVLTAEGIWCHWPIYRHANLLLCSEQNCQNFLWGEEAVSLIWVWNKML